MNKNTVILVGASVVLLFIVYLLLRLIVRIRSKKVREIKAMNKTYDFYDFDDVYELTVECKTKQKYNTINVAHYIMGVLETPENDIIDLYDMAAYNNDLFREYEEEFQDILSAEENRVFKGFIMRLIEKSICKKKKLAPLIDFTLCVNVAYTSTQGRNSYEKTLEYSFKNIEYMIYKLRGMQDYKETKKYQRAMMTDSLRYDVFKRDNFRCQICGATAKDGATLHVDHIVPVSRGGKTEMDNLRTLCDQCNMGKSDKYDPFGVN